MVVFRRENVAGKNKVATAATAKTPKKNLSSQRTAKGQGASLKARIRRDREHEGIPVVTLTDFNSLMATGTLHSKSRPGFAAVKLDIQSSGKHTATGKRSPPISKARGKGSPIEKEGLRAKGCSRGAMGPGKERMTPTGKSRVGKGGREGSGKDKGKAKGSKGKASRFRPVEASKDSLPMTRVDTSDPCRTPEPTGVYMVDTHRRSGSTGIDSRTFYLGGTCETREELEQREKRKQQQYRDELQAQLAERQAAKKGTSGSQANTMDGSDGTVSSDSPCSIMSFVMMHSNDEQKKEKQAKVKALLDQQVAEQMKLRAKVERERLAREAAEVDTMRREIVPIASREYQQGHEQGSPPQRDGATRMNSAGGIDDREKMISYPQAVIDPHEGKPVAQSVPQCLALESVAGELDTLRSRLGDGMLEGSLSGTTRLVRSPPSGSTPKRKYVVPRDGRDESEDRFEVDRTSKLIDSLSSNEIENTTEVILAFLRSNSGRAEGRWGGPQIRASGHSLGLPRGGDLLNVQKGQRSLVTERSMVNISKFVRPDDLIVGDRQGDPSRESEEGSRPCVATVSLGGSSSNRDEVLKPETPSDTEGPGEETAGVVSDGYGQSGEASSTGDEFDTTPRGDHTSSCHHSSSLSIPPLSTSLDGRLHLGPWSSSHYAAFITTVLDTEGLDCSEEIAEVLYHLQAEAALEERMTSSNDDDRLESAGSSSDSSFLQRLSDDGFLLSLAEEDDTPEFTPNESGSVGGSPLVTDRYVASSFIEDTAGTGGWSESSGNAFD